MEVKLPLGWRLLSVESCTSAIIDYRGKSPNKTIRGIPLITAKVVKNGRILQPDEFIPAEEYEISMRRGLPQPGDVVVTTEAPLGEVAQLGSERVALAQRLILLRARPTVLDQNYLLYAMQSSFVQRQLSARSTGTTVHGIRQSELRKVLLPVPPLDEQRGAAYILCLLDKRVQINLRINQTLEAMARAIFKSWFVDFGPEREGKTWPIKIGRVADLALLRKDVLNPADYPEEEFDHYSIPSFDEGRVAKTERGKEIKSNKSVVVEGSILLSKINPRIPRVWLPQFSYERRSICSTEFLVVWPKEDGDREFLYSLFCSTEFIDEFASRATGTSGSHQRVRPDDLMNIECPLPGREARDAFSRTVRPMFDRIAHNREESRTLSALRDTLLPKLLSGEIRVKQAEKIVEEAV